MNEPDPLRATGLEERDERRIEMADVTKIKELPGWGKGFAELYLVDGDYMVVSTIGNVGEGADVVEHSIIRMGHMLGGYAVSGEETMAFLCDEDGEVLDWTEQEASTGPGSRQEVIEALETR